MTERPAAPNRLAVLIDADNRTVDVIEELLAALARFGVATVKRAYGNWTTPQLQGWKAVLLEHSIQPMQQFANTAGKNATDSAMIIDAMDLLYTRRLDGFCLVSSDNDFTALARRIREDGLRVIGCGEDKASALRSACTDYIVTKSSRPGSDTPKPGVPKPTPKAKSKPQRATRKAAEPKTSKASAAPKPAAPKPTPPAAPKHTPPKPTPPPELVGMIREALETVRKDDAGWAHAGAVGKQLNEQPDYTRLSRQLGYTKLSDLVKAIPAFKVEVRSAEEGKPTTLYIRDARPRG